ncbi:hypothetical protein MPH_05069 [Macrophomina phaseolina MS6]|uniref:Mg2+ transporter protein CorA-like/Zinc transport protein ZntB n=1 Tax=Macrophomina phaseolina (strain MS6) TaxID=1126212 RepID=K2R5I1_MACPH|nr:hypothetical protein MPH_05069 [Macrophomina phaseolina MS6]
MFHAQRKRVLREAVWKPWRAGRLKEHENLLPSLQSIQHERYSTKEEDIQFFEFWKHEESKAAQPGFNCFAGIIQDDHVADWLNQRGSFALRKNNLYRKVTGGIRILVCEQRGSDPLNFPISRESYLRMEKDFRLSPATLPYFKNSSYNHAWQRNTSEGRNDLVLIAKPPSNGLIVAPSLSLTHDLDTSTTTAFLYGPNLLSTSSNTARSDGVPQIALLREILEACTSLWAHPLLLPTALLAVCVDQTQAFCSQEIEGKFNRVDEGLGIMAGGDGNKRSADAMSKEVNNLVTGMAELACVSGWQVRFAGVLGDMMEKTEELVDVNGMAGDEMRDIVEQLKTTAQSVEEVVKGLRVRAGLQADTLRNFLSQTTNLLAAQLTAAATRNGASVKTIALLNTLFLPAIFVAVSLPPGPNIMLSTFETNS